ncbi:MAG TPA: phosphodiester glycosidase family protein [Clostridiaceae bacterium]|nr:phosphodiester glycosidase family protein [Clostridiaceae bacterium]
MKNLLKKVSRIVSSKRNKLVKPVIIIILAAVAVSFIIFYAGHFLFEKVPEKQPDTVPPATTHEGKPEMKPLPLKYTHNTEYINGYKQQVHVLEVGLSDPRIEVKPILSFDKVFGFEKLSEMVKRSGAYAAINSGFYHKYGQPSGMVVIDGKMFSNSTGKYPVFVIKDGKAGLHEIQTKLWINFPGGKFRVDNINAEGKKGEVVVFTPEYGSSNKVVSENTTVVVRNGLAEQIVKAKGETGIPKDGMLITFFSPVKGDIPFKTGDALEFEFEPYMDNNSQAYECGSWIVKDGEIVIGEWDEWVGVLTNRDPRTAIGLKDDGTVVLLVVDGRQPEFSAGLKGYELGELLLKYGVKNAAMLDGGASTEMIIDGRIVNKPSFKGEERPLAGGIIVKVNK